MQPEPMTLGPDPPAEADREWTGTEAGKPSPESYMMVERSDGTWTAWRVSRSVEAGYKVDTMRPLGHFGNYESASEECRIDAVRRHADRTINAAEAARARVPLDDRPPPEREEPYVDEMTNHGIGPRITRNWAGPANPEWWRSLSGRRPMPE